MTIDEAIEQLDLMLKYPLEPMSDRDRNSVKIGIEALKRLKYMRTTYYRPISEPLPNETE